MNKVVLSPVFSSWLLRPPRRYYPQFLQHYEAILGTLVTAILAVEGAPHIGLRVLVWIGLYGFYWVLMRRLRNRVGERWDKEWLHLGRALTLIFGVSFFIVDLYINSDYVSARSSPDTLWLLFLLANAIVILHGRASLLTTRTFVMFATANVIAIVFLEVLKLIITGGLSSFTTTEKILLALFPILAKLLWLSILTFMLYVFMRYMVEQLADVQLLHAVEDQIAPIRDESEKVQSLVDLVAHNFGYKHVNLFRVERDGSLLCIAGAGTHGRDMVARNFTVTEPHSMVMHAARTGEVYATNDVTRTVDAMHKFGFYWAAPEFPDTKAEAAIPIQLNNRVWAVLDIEVPLKNYFVPSDIEVLQVMAGHFGRLLASLRILEYSRRMTHSFLLPNESSAVLHLALEDALAQTGASSLVLFERDPVEADLRPAAFVGTIETPDMVRWNKVVTGGLVERLMEVGGFYFHSHAQAAENEDPLFAPSHAHTVANIPTFVERESVQSRATIVLEKSGTPVGVLFFNFNTTRSFDGDEEARNEMLNIADIVKVALSRNQEHRKQVAQGQKIRDQERSQALQDLSVEMHDRILHRLGTALNYVGGLYADTTSDQEQHRILGHVRGLLSNMIDDVRRIVAVEDDEFKGNLQAEVLHIVEEAQFRTTAQISLEWEGTPFLMASDVEWQLKAIIMEVLQNATEHSMAGNIELRIKVDEDTVSVTVEDDGKGFAIGSEATNTSKDQHGLQNLRSRVQRLGGSRIIERGSNDGGTLIRIKVPITKKHNGGASWIL